MVGTGPFNFTVTPASTTTYTASGTDVNGCPITMKRTSNGYGIRHPHLLRSVARQVPARLADSSCQAAIPNVIPGVTAS